ncbi:MAG TPA: carbohydrate porin [Usitatibacter sp.]|nr:carbohydrate porin [Usitatibacter sp.]
MWARTLWAAMGVLAVAARAEEPSREPEPWNIHGQLTFVQQAHPSFTSPYEGPNSLLGERESKETVDVTLFLGARLWSGAAFYLNPEIDQGFGVSDTLGVAGFPSGAAYKVGQYRPYFRLQRAFVRQRFDLGGEAQAIEPGPNELGGTLTADNVTITAGKFAVTDVFDNNRYAHDSRGDFMNWSVIDTAGFDYAADAWGYTAGVAVEWTKSWWTLRGGFFDLSDVPNSTHLEPGFKEFELMVEAEGRYELGGRPGKVKGLAFVSHAHMGSYADALALAQSTGTTPDTAAVRRSAQRAGATINAEQEIAADVGAFVRLGFNQGDKEAFDFTDVNRSLSLGVSLGGRRWGRAEDNVGVALSVNDISSDARRYFAGGGLGILVGDGRLPSAGTEQIFEAYYSWRPAEHLTVSADYQHVANPAYNRDRGPVSLYAIRVHADF